MADSSELPEAEPPEVRKGWRRFAKTCGSRRRMILTLVILVAHGAGLLTSIRAIMEVRTAQGAVAWAVALNTFPYVSVPAYWVFGRSKFQGFAILRQRHVAETDPVAREFLQRLVEEQLVAQPERTDPLLVERLARMPATTGNRVELLIDGEATFASILAGIEAAREYVLMQFYILRADILGREVQRRLIAKAQSGVRVHVLYDEIGCGSLEGAYLAEMKSAGIQVLPFNTTQGPANRWQLNFRNHRKIVVTDGTTAWVGGHNVGDEYMGRDPKIGRWRDTHVKLTGPVVPTVQLVFFEDWHWASGRLLKLEWDPSPDPGGSQQTALCLASGPADTFETATLFFLHAIHSAKHRLWIATPYFVPDEQFVSALQLAALRGVDVRILVPETTDSALVQLSGWSYVPQLTPTGVKFFRYSKGFLHQKVMLVDDDYATVGTANFDNRSFRLNFEVTIGVADPAFGAAVKAMLEEDFIGAKPALTEHLTGRNFWYRFSVRLARLMAPIQ